MWLARSCAPVVAVCNDYLSERDFSVEWLRIWLANDVQIFANDRMASTPSTPKKDIADLPKFEYTFFGDWHIIQ
jgi:hypothetical protein